MIGRRFGKTLDAAKKAIALERTVVAKTQIRLRGGPMDGFIVAPDAPALQPAWHTTWPASIKTPPGQYVLKGRTARWQSL